MKPEPAPKRPPRRPRSPKAAPPGAGKATADRRRRPTPGWKAWADIGVAGWRNPRTPAVPATLQISLDEYFTATSLMGLLSSQAAEPDQAWCCDWSFGMGEKMAREARRRRRRRQAR
jgi:hypothetical protein